VAIKSRRGVIIIHEMQSVKDNAAPTEPGNIITQISTHMSALRAFIQ
jgi:hypothetical protein